MKFAQDNPDVDSLWGKSIIPIKKWNNLALYFWRLILTWFLLKHLMYNKTDKDYSRSAQSWIHRLKLHKSNCNDDFHTPFWSTQTIMISWDFDRHLIQSRKIMISWEKEIKSSKFQVLYWSFILISCSNACDIQNLSLKKNQPQKMTFENMGIYITFKAAKFWTG